MFAFHDQLPPVEKFDQIHDLKCPAFPKQITNKSNCKTAALVTTGARPLPIRRYYFYEELA